MSSGNRFCRYCGNELTGGRADQIYCAKSTCRSLYHQESGRDYRGDDIEHLVHVELEHLHTYYCVVCGEQFEVNDYALRGGKRTPMYHNRACKQKAYRRRKKSANKG